jgi:hypothetical protein
MPGPPFTVEDVIDRVRKELGDLGTPFRDSFAGTGEIGEFDLSESSIASVQVTTVLSGVVTTLVQDRDYALMPEEGRILLLGSLNPLADNTTLIVTGVAQGMFSDEELTGFITEAVSMHCQNRRVTSRVRDSSGFIRMVESPLGLLNLPEIELLPLCLLATVNALWALATDASTDIDITTAEGTHVGRGQRFQQLMAMIDAVTARYKELCEQLQIGYYRIEMGNLRRVSRTTGRLIPLYEEREFDDYRLPQRLIPEVDHKDDDTSQLPDQGYGGGYW